jgi:hypothetical protein
MPLVITLIGQPFACVFGQFEGHAAVGKLDFQLHDELVDDLVDNLHAADCRTDDRIQTVAELRSEQLVDRLHVVAFALGAT